MNTPGEHGTEQKPERKQQRIALLVISTCGLILISGVAVALYFPKPLSSRHALVWEHLGGVGKAQVIASAHTVKAWRTLGSFRDEETQTGENFGDLYQKTGSPAVVPSQLSTQLRRILLDPASYMDFDPPREKMSVTMPCVVLNFADDKADVDVFISFADNILQVEPAKPVQPGSRRMAQGDFDPVRKELIQIMKQVFPADRQIQSLNETDSGGLLWPHAIK